MNNSMVSCPECGKWYFNRSKLTNHLVLKHDYVIELPETPETANE